MAALSAIADPDGGGDYLSLQALDTGEGQDLTDGGGDTFSAVMTSSGGTADSTVCTISGWTMSAANFLEIVADTGHEAVKTGIDAAKARMSISNPSSHILSIFEEFVRVENLQIEKTSSNVQTLACIFYAIIGAPNELRISSCYLKQAGNNSFVEPVFDVEDTQAIVKIWTTVLTGASIGGSPNNASVWVELSDTVDLFNCVLHGGSRGVTQVGGTVTLVNSAIFKTQVADFAGTVARNFCASGDGGGTNEVAESGGGADWPFDFEDAGNGDFTLLIGSNLKGAGLNDPGSGLFSTDIDGDNYVVDAWSLGVDEFVSGGAAIFASISDGLGINDTIATKTGHARSISDGLGISDTLTRIGTYIRSLASNLATTDTINTARNLKRSIAENVGVTDDITTKKFVLVALSDNLGITDVLTRIVAFFRSIPDTLAISDIVTTIRTISRSVSDGVGITDVLTSEKFILVAIADTVGITDTIATIGTFIRSVIDGVGITDVVTRIGTFIRSESDNVGVTDTITASKGASRTITDGVGITDVIAAVLGKLSSIADNLGLTDVLTFIKTTVVGGRVFIAGVAKSLRISGNAKSLTISGEDKSLKISGSGD